LPLKPLYSWLSVCLSVVHMHDSSKSKSLQDGMVLTPISPAYPMPVCPDFRFEQSFSHHFWCPCTCAWIRYLSS